MQREFRNRKEGKKTEQKTHTHVAAEINCNGVVIWNSMLYNQTEENAKEKKTPKNLCSKMLHT